MNNGLPVELLSDIAKQYGTPVYVYDAGGMAAQYRRLRKAFSDQPVRFFYAAKALTNIHVIRYIHSLGASIDCSSINELKLARYAGVSSGNILYTSNGVGFEEIEEAVEAGVKINIDSLSNLEKFGRKFGGTYPVGIRLRPNVMAGAHLNISTGHNKSKFGIPIEQLDDILDLVRKYDLKITVLHEHTGSGISDVEKFMEAVYVLLKITGYFPYLKCIDLGGGFKVPFKPGDAEMDVELLSDRIKAAFSDIEREQGKRLEIWFEPGKFLVSGAGYLVSRVNVIKQTASVTFAGLDTGFNHLIRPMFYGAYHQIENISNPRGKTKKYAVVGNICETDTFAWDRELPEIREGDLLVFKNAGAYGFEMASNFNSRFRPAEVLVKDGVPELIRRRDTMDDLLRNQIF